MYYDTNFDGVADAFDSITDGFGYGYTDYGYGGYGYTPSELAAGYSGTDSRLIEPGRFAGANRLISGNDTSSNL